MKTSWLIERVRAATSSAARSWTCPSQPPTQACYRPLQMHGSVGEHIGAVTLEGYSLQELGPEVLEAADGHLLICAVCRDRLAEIEPFNTVHYTKDGPFYLRVTHLRGWIICSPALGPPGRRRRPLRRSCCGVQVPGRFVRSDVPRTRMWRSVWRHANEPACALRKLVPKPANVQAWPQLRASAAVCAPRLSGRLRGTPPPAIRHRGHHAASALPRQMLCI